MDTHENDEHNGEIREELSFHKQRTSSIYNDEYSGEIEVVEMNGSSTDKRLMDFIPIYNPPIEKALIAKSHREKRFLDFLKALVQYFKKWIRSPPNIALFIWLVLCAIGLVWLFLLMVGVLNGAIPSNEQRKIWEEDINQILNALFTLMCVYQHPTIFHHLVLVLRWRPNDQVAARSTYSKNGIRRPHERAHILFVVSLLHLTCAAQYVYCALFWGWSRQNRPDWPQYVSLSVGVAAPVIAAWFTYYGPLGKNIIKARTDENSSTQANGATQSKDTEVALYHQRVLVTTPEWIGGLFDCWEDMTVTCLSFFCTLCVFGWNMERLGLGNKYVHIVTFLILCVAPFWIFSISAINVNDDTIRLIVAITGVVCCVFGLLYGGYWRSRIREKFKLPGNPFCCGYPLMTDFVQWLLCWSCSLAQEVRTANFYDIEDDGFYSKVNDEENRPALVPLPMEGNSRNLDSHQSFSSPPKPESINTVSPREMSECCSPTELSITLGMASKYSKVHAMTPPVPRVMQTEDEYPIHKGQPGATSIPR